MTSSDYKSALEATRKLMKNMQNQNKQLIKALEYYAYSDMKDIVMLDQGRKAREVLNK